MSIDQILGLITGLVFGFLMQKGRVIRFEKQVGALLIKDMTIFKFMLSAIMVGMAGIYILYDMGIITLSHKPMNVGAVVKMFITITDMKATLGPRTTSGTKASVGMAVGWS